MKISKKNMIKKSKIVKKNKLYTLKAIHVSLSIKTIKNLLISGTNNNHNL